MKPDWSDCHFFDYDGVATTKLKTGYCVTDDTNPVIYSSMCRNRGNLYLLLYLIHSEKLERITNVT